MAIDLVAAFKELCRVRPDLASPRSGAHIVRDPDNPNCFLGVTPRGHAWLHSSLKDALRELNQLDEQW